MQQLVKETNSRVSASDCSEQLIEVVPLIMRHIRKEMRYRTLAGLSIPQFRALNYLLRHPQASLSDVAEFLGLTLPSTSKLVQKLVTQKIVKRRTAADRRRICLSLTDQGRNALAQAQIETREQLAEVLKKLTTEELKTVHSALTILAPFFSKGLANETIS